jgi:hypothetical protein
LDRELKLEFEFSSRAENIGTENIGIELYLNKLKFSIQIRIKQWKFAGISCEL